MAAFMASVIARIMGPVAIMIWAVILFAQFSVAIMISVAAALAVAEILLVLATLAPVFIIIAIKVPIGVDPMLMLSCQLVLLNGLSAMLFVLVFFMLVLFM